MDRCIYVFLEGYKDERFFTAVLEPILGQRYAAVVPWQYARRSKDDVVRALRSVREGNAHYLFVRDIDTWPCVTARKQNLFETYGKRIDPARVVVVVKEIESWYLAGLDDEGRQEYGISPNRHRHTDDLSKEQFEGLVPTKYSVVDFMGEILGRFQIEVARGRNRSFGYLMNLLETQSEKA